MEPCPREGEEDSEEGFRSIVKSQMIENSKFSLYFSITPSIIL